MKILIADDDPVSLLERRGYEIVVVSDGRAAVRELSKPDGPRLALLDWMMPELDGSEVCREIRRQQDGPYIYILLLTSRQSTADIVAGLEAGADDYLTKPFNPAELNARLLTGQRILRLEEELVRAREAMRFRATHDGLTGLLNRTGILHRLQASMDKMHRDDAPFFVLLGDVDHFKKINDAHGHSAGDAVLQEIGMRLREAVDPYGAVGRYGGEEFLIILQDSGQGSLPARAEAIRRSINAHPIDVPNGQLTVFLSLGAAVVTREHHTHRLEEVLECVDKALYLAKAQGRNCVRIGELPSTRCSGAVSIARITLPGRDTPPLASFPDRTAQPTLHRPQPAALLEAAHGAAA